MSLLDLQGLTSEHEGGKPGGGGGGGGGDGGGSNLSVALCDGWAPSYLSVALCL